MDSQQSPSHLASPVPTHTASGLCACGPSITPLRRVIEISQVPGFNWCLHLDSLLFSSPQKYNLKVVKFSHQLLSLSQTRRAPTDQQTSHQLYLIYLFFPFIFPFIFPFHIHPKSLSSSPFYFTKPGDGLEINKLNKPRHKNAG